MYKKFTLFLFLFCLSFTLSGQNEENLWNTHLLISQKENTNELLKRYLAPVPSSSDILYAILFIPSYCPRCEGIIPLFIKDIKKNFPQEETLIITPYPDSTSVQRYLERNQYEAHHYLVDTSNAYSQIFSFNSNGLTGLYILKLDKKNGRMIIGGEPLYYSENFVKELHKQKIPQPYYTYEKESTPENAYKKTASASNLEYETYSLHTDTLYPVSSVYGTPILKDSVFMYTDELGNAAYYFQVNAEKQTVWFIQPLLPDSSEQDRYLELPAEILEFQKKNGQIFYMPQTPNFLGEKNIGISYSLPRMFMEDSTHLAYYNQACLLTRDRQTLKKGPIITLDFDIFNEKYMYHHFSFYPLGPDRIILGCQKNTWPIEYEPEDYQGNMETDPFMDAFYQQENPYLAIFDLKTGKLVRRFGNLDEPQRLSRTGYYFLNPVVDTYKEEIIYGNGYLGQLYLADQKNPDQAKAKYSFFKVDTASFPSLNPETFYKQEHARAYDSFFNRQIIAVALTETQLHCIISSQNTKDHSLENTDFEYVVMDKDMQGDMISYPLIPQSKNERVLTYGLAKRGNEVTPYYFAKQGENAFIRFVILAKE